MQWIIIFGLGLLVGYLLGKGSTQAQPGGLAGVNKARQGRREKQKQQVMALFASKDKIANDDVENLLGVSDATATRVLDELEADGLIEAEGNTKGTVYKKK